MQNELISTIRQSFAQCVFNHKVHEKAAERLYRKQKHVSWANLAVLTIVLVLLVFQLNFPETTAIGFIAMIVTIFEIVFLFFQKEFSYSKDASENKKVALQYLALRDRYKNLISDVKIKKTIQLTTERDYLQAEYAIIVNLSTQTENIDYISAQMSLLGTTNTDEEYTWSDAEINRFLPKELHSK